MMSALNFGYILWVHWSLHIELHLPPAWIVGTNFIWDFALKVFLFFSGFRGSWSHYIFINWYTKAQKWGFLKSFPSPISWYTDKFSSSNGGYLLLLYILTLQLVVSWTYMAIRTFFFFVEMMCRFHSFTHILWSFFLFAESPRPSKCDIV